MIRMNKRFKARWQQEGMDDWLKSVILQPRLQTLVNAPFVRKAGGLLLAPLVAHATSPEIFQDRTGYEAFINKFHVDDFMDAPDEMDKGRLNVLFQQGAKAAIILSERLEKEGAYRVFLSLDVLSLEEGHPTMTLRFFERRIGEPWGDDDLDSYPLDEILMIDTNA